jgi:hypothetical protein
LEIKSARNARTCSETPARWTASRTSIRPRIVSRAPGPQDSRTGDCFLRKPLEDFDDRSIRRTHHNRGAIGDQALRTERRKMVSNKFHQCFLAPGSWLVASDCNRSHWSCLVVRGDRSYLWPTRCMTVSAMDPAARHQKLKRTPPNASKGAAGLKNRLSIPAPLVTPLGGIPGAPTPVGSLRIPQVA